MLGADETRKLKKIIKYCWYIGRHRGEECPGKELFLPGHFDRLLAVMDGCWNCVHNVSTIGEYIRVGLINKRISLLGEKDLVSALKSILSDHVRLIGVMLESEGLGPWLIGALRDSLDNAVNSSAFSRHDPPYVIVAVIGVDKPTGKYFVHVLPPPLSMLGLMCQALDSEKPLRVLMGFDYHSWEYRGGSGRVRVQGDLVLEVLRELDSGLDEAYINTVMALAVDTVLAGLYDYVDQAVKSRITRELSQIDSEEDNVPKAIMRGVFRASEDLLGVSIGIPEVSPVIPHDDQNEWLDVEYYMVDYAMLFVDKWTWFVDSPNNTYNKGLDYVRKASSIINVERILYKPLLTMGSAPRPQGIESKYYETLIGSLEQYEVPRPSTLRWRTDESQVIVDVTRPVNLIYTVMRSIVLDRLWSREPAGWAELCADPKSLDNMPKVLGSIGRRLCELWTSSRLFRIEVENHTIYAEARRVTGTLYATSILLKEAEAIARKMYYFARLSPEASCSLEALDAITRAFAAKTGEELVLLEGTVRIDHPEHGRAEIRFPKPVLARITTMNSWNIQQG